VCATTEAGFRRRKEGRGNDCGPIRAGKDLATNGDGIVVNASNVVIDLGVYTITQSQSGGGNNAVGIAIGTANPTTNVIVSNGVISGFYMGVNLFSGSQFIVQNLQLLSSYTYGVYVNTASDSQIQSCFMVGTGAAINYGIAIYSGSAIQVSNDRIIWALHNLMASCLIGLQTDGFRSPRFKVRE
jgi:hypothetical protein